IGTDDAIGYDPEFARSHRSAYALPVRLAGRGSGAHNPERLDAAVARSLKPVDRFQPRVRGAIRLAPETAEAITVRPAFQRHMGRELVGETADFAASHRVRLASDGEGPRSGLSDAPRCEMAIDDRVDLVRAARRLVHPLRIDRDGTRRR